MGTRNRAFFFRTYGLIVSPWKFDVLKTSTASLLGLKHQISAGQLAADSFSTIIPPLRRVCLKVSHQVMLKFDKDRSTSCVYLVAINLHDCCPCPVSTSKIPHVTINGSWCWAKVERNKPTCCKTVRYLTISSNKKH